MGKQKPEKEKFALKCPKAGPKFSNDASMDASNGSKPNDGPKWTGKQPLNLFQEFIQKQGNLWLKPIYEFHENSKGFQCRITLSKKNKKSGEIEKLTFYPPLDCVCASKNEAKQASSTYVLHRLCSERNLHTLLPPFARMLWLKFDQLKNDKDPDVLMIEYAADPWDAREKALLNKNAGSNQKSSNSNSNPWDDYPSLYIPKDLREQLENMIRDNQEVAVNEGSRNNLNLNLKDTRQIKQLLIKKGFREANVEEALLYRSELGQLLDWLAIHVPEDDLPLAQRPTDHKSIVLSNQTAEELARQYMVDRLHAVGFPRFECIHALEECSWDEFHALARLCYSFSGMELADTRESYNHQEISEIIIEEKGVLESIYDHNLEHEQSELGHKFSITIEKLTVSLLIPNASSYPHQVPGIAILSNEYPAYIRLAVLKSVFTEAVTSFVGSQMMFSIIGAIEQTLPVILESPPPLKSLYTRGEKMSLPSSSSSSRSLKLKNGKKASRKLLNLPSSETLKKQKLEKETSNIEYKKMLLARQKLPSFKYKDRITNSLVSNQCLIICGETGCGKSTQTGQFILDDHIDRGLGQQCYIICTQPRRISATSLADRVSAERAEQVGSQIGYSIRGLSKQSSQTQLLFCTNGVLLRMMQEDVDLSTVSHVIIDEVHERGADSDFLLVLLRDLLPRRPDLRVILMSATIDATTISAYFNQCPVLEIPGRTFPVSDFHLEDVLHDTGYVPENTGLGIKSGGKKVDDEVLMADWTQVFEKVGNLNLAQKSKIIQAEKSVQFQIDYGLIAACVKMICASGEVGAILIFLPGVMEIKKAITRIKMDASEFQSQLEIFPLHSMLTSQEQSAVFQRMQPGKRKVVVSTNIAETSVTIDDVVFCIDTGRVKEMKLVNGILSLTEVWASKASCKQRKGRAGRVKPGKCYKLFTSYFEEQSMKNHSEPEILRLPLEQLCLQIKAMGILDVAGFLGKALSPPPTANITDALDLLENVNALGKDGRLTPLGHHISLLPTDVRVGKMLVFGAIFHCLDPVLTIAACISGKGPFNSPLDKRQEAAAAQRKFALYKSDFLAAALAFEEWQSRNGRERKDYSEENYLSMTNLMAMQDLRKQFVDLLGDIGYVSRNNYDTLNENSKNDKIVKSVILAGLFPNIASIKMPTQVFNKTAEGTVAVNAQSSEIKYFASGERVFLHPSSQLFSEQKYEEAVMVYGTKVSTSKIFLRDCSVAPNLALLLLGGEIQTLHGGNSVSISNVRFKAFPRVTSLVQGMRRLLDVALEEKIKHPDADVIQTAIGKLCLDLLLI